VGLNPAERADVNGLKNLITAIDSHTAGEGTRLVISGLPRLRGDSMAEKMAQAQLHYSWLPGYLLLEPRGHKDLYGAWLVEPADPRADWGVLFMNNQGYETMCGHGLMGVATCLIETGMHPCQEPETRLLMDTPAGLVTVLAQVQAGLVQGVTFENVPAFVFQQEVDIVLPGGVSCRVDVVFGGNFFALVHTRQLGVELSIENVPRLTELGMQVRQVINERISVQHPQMAHIQRVIDVRFYHEVEKQGVNSRNIVVLGNRMIDRSPCGTGTCAELALLYQRGELKLGEPWVCESLLDTRFTGRIVAQTQVGNEHQSFDAIIPQVSGRAYLTGWRLFTPHPEDPFPQGFLIP